MAEAYDGSFARLCAGAAPALLTSIEQAANPGARLLDIGTGTGTIAFAAACRGFSVEAVDSESTMIDFARERHAHAGIDFAIGRLPDLIYSPGTFEAVTANFVINHTLDPLASLQEICRVMKPGASLGVTIWPAEISALNSLWNEVINQARATRPVATRLPPEKDFERSPAGLRSLMAKAGFEVIDVSEISWTFDISPADLWQAPTAGIATIGATYRAQDDSTQERMKSAFIELTTPLVKDGELHLATTAILGAALRTN